MGLWDGHKKGNSISIRFLGVGLFELEIMHFIPSCKTKAITKITKKIQRLQLGIFYNQMSSSLASTKT